MNCPKCGTPNRDTAKFCSNCGTTLAPKPARPTSTPLSTPAANASPVQSARDVSRQPTRPLSRPANVADPAANQAPGSESPQAKMVTRPLPHKDHTVPLSPKDNVATDPTIQLPNLPVGFAALPKGALLHRDRYEIQQIRTEGAKINVYQVHDRQAIRHCPNPDCGAIETDPDTQHCNQCGIDLSQTQPVHLTYLLREAADLTQFDAEGQLIQRGLKHPGLILPQDHFIETLYANSRRAYLLVPEFTPLLAVSLAAPQELPQVLNWGVQLANAMAYLHEHHVSLRPATLQHDLNRVAIEERGRIARWTHLAGVDIIPAAAQDTAPKKFAQDVRMLAQILFYLGTGRENYTSEVNLPQDVQDLFARALDTQSQSFTSAQAFSAALEEALAQVRRPASIDLVVGRRSDVGQERQLNEDGLLILVLNQVEESLSHPLALLVVADGMGGHSAGEVATHLTLDTVREKFVTELLDPGTQTPNYEQWLKDATTAANTAVFENRRNIGSDMGNTLVMAVVTGETSFLSNVGDSRAYLINEREILKITTDHSLVERLVATGKISPQEARTHPQRNMIYRTIGDKSRVETDVFTQRLQVGNYLLLCSDGLNGMITDQKIFDIVHTSTCPQNACDRLVKAANEAGGEDNITVIAVQAIAG